MTVVKHKIDIRMEFCGFPSSQNAVSPESAMPIKALSLWLAKRPQSPTQDRP